MGVFTFVSIALFAIGSYALNIPLQWSKNADVVNENSSNELKNWVILVAGSKGWSNYRHQADICHAYQIVKGNGIPEENIITMMVDDIAYNLRNPTPGKIINRPEGENVYDGVVIDYSGTDVTKTNFLNILIGNKTAMESIGSGKVIEGGPRDIIFINFVDHGSTGLLSFPSEYLFADELDNALNTMYENKLYKKALLYIEACEAGSMFDGILSEDKNIMAVTASGPRESSYACYCKFYSWPYRTCLGDLFSTIWMENVDATAYDYSSYERSVFNDFKEVRTNVTESNVMIYGDFRIGDENLATFIGYRDSEESSPKRIKKTIIQKDTGLSSRDVQEESILHELINVKSSKQEKEELTSELLLNNKNRLIIDRVLMEIYSYVVKARPDIENDVGEYDHPKDLDLSLDIFPCYRSILNQITVACFSLPENPYALTRLKIFANFCIVDKQIHSLVNNVINEICSRTPQKNILNVF